MRCEAEHGSNVWEQPAPADRCARVVSRRSGGASTSPSAPRRRALPPPAGRAAAPRTRCVLQQTRAALPLRLTRSALRIENPDRWQLAGSRNDSTARLSFSARGGGGGEPDPAEHHELEDEPGGQRGTGARGRATSRDLRLRRGLGGDSPLRSPAGRPVRRLDVRPSAVRARPVRLGGLSVLRSIYRVCMVVLLARRLLNRRKWRVQAQSNEVVGAAAGGRVVPELGIKAGKGAISTSSQDAHTVVLYYNAILSLHASLISSSRAAPGCSHASPQAAPHTLITGRGSRQPRRHHHRSCWRCQRCAPPGAATTRHAPPRGAWPPLTRHVIEGHVNSVIGHT